MTMWTDSRDPYEIGKVMGARDAVMYAGQMGLRAIKGREDAWAEGYRDGYFHAMSQQPPQRRNGRRTR